jgi:hypothetical protein
MIAQPWFLKIVKTHFVLSTQNSKVFGMCSIVQNDEMLISAIKGSSRLEVMSPSNFFAPVIR